MYFYINQRQNVTFTNCFLLDGAGVIPVRGKLADSASNLKSVRYPLAVNQLVPLPKDYSELINRVSTFTYVS